jgi:hypothetical protein
MKELKKKSIIYSIAFLFIISYLIVGYIYSDAVFFKQFVKESHIKTPDQAWNYVISNTSPNDSLDVPPKGLSARYMLTKKKQLSCDEGALVLATILRELGYKTTLVDLYGYSTRPFHTILEVEVNGKLFYYDTFCRLRHEEPKVSANKLGYELVKIEKRPSWSLYRSIVYYNRFSKYIIFKLRNIRED